MNHLARFLVIAVMLLLITLVLAILSGKPSVYTGLIIIVVSAFITYIIRPLE